MPAGLWRIPLTFNEGIVQVAFTAAGNYLNGKGIYLKTKPHAINLPLAEGQKLVLRYDASGKLIDQPQLPRRNLQDIVVGETGPHSGPSSATNTASQMPDGSTTAVLAKPEEPELPLIPVWFVALISLMNLLIIAGIWWFNRPPPLPFEPA